jgi:hypothetical protein
MRNEIFLKLTQTKSSSHDCKTKPLPEKSHEFCLAN